MEQDAVLVPGVGRSITLVAQPDRVAVRGRGSTRTPRTPYDVAAFRDHSVSYGVGALRPATRIAEVGGRTSPLGLGAEPSIDTATRPGRVHREAHRWVGRLHYYSGGIIPPMIGPESLGRESGLVLEMSGRSWWAWRDVFGNRADSRAWGRSLTNPTKSKPGPGTSVFGVPDVVFG